MLSQNNIKEILSILGNENVLTTKEERYCYSVDACNTYENNSIADIVAFPKNSNQVQEIVKFASQYKIPIIPRGAGTNMVGSCVCDRGGIILNFSKMDKIIDINTQNMTMKVQPGTILGNIKNECLKNNLLFPPDPSNYKVSTIGGAIAEASAGASAIKYGTIRDYILSLKVVMPDGSIAQYGSDTMKNSVGYPLQQLFIGSEGTLGVIIEATLKLIPKPQQKKVIVTYFNDIQYALNTVSDILKSKILPSAIDFMDNNAIVTVSQYKDTDLNTNAQAMLLIDVDGSDVSVEYDLQAMLRIIKNNNGIDIKISANEEEYDKYWDARRSSYAAVARLAPDVVSDDIIVPRNKIFEAGKYCKEIEKKYNLKICLIGHLGDGNLHPQFAVDLSDALQKENYKKARNDLYKYVKNLGGIFSGEHGVGLEKKAYINDFIDASSLKYMKMIKRIVDPENIMNPGKIFDL